MQAELRDDWVTPTEPDAFSEPGSAESEWWSKCRAKAVLLVVGGFEIFRDDILMFGEKLKAAMFPLQAVECPSQVHMDCILDSQGDLEHGIMSQTIWEWLQQVL